MRKLLRNPHAGKQQREVNNLHPWPTILRQRPLRIP
jgi:hypothetical protein